MEAKEVHSNLMRVSDVEKRAVRNSTLREEKEHKPWNTSSRKRIGFVFQHCRGVQLPTLDFGLDPATLDQGRVRSPLPILCDSPLPDVKKLVLCFEPMLQSVPAPQELFFRKLLTLAMHKDWTDDEEEDWRSTQGFDPEHILHSVVSD
jgi:hypothetical protein